MSTPQNEAKPQVNQPAEKSMEAKRPKKSSNPITLQNGCYTRVRGGKQVTTKVAADFRWEDCVED
jgi:hypothetical protein